MRKYESKSFFHDQSFPLTVSKARQQDFMIEHSHDFIELVLVNSGKSLHRLSNNASSSGASYSLIRGEVFAVMPGELHSYWNSKNFEIYNIAFLPQVIAGELAELNELKGIKALLQNNKQSVTQNLYLDTAHRELAAKYLQSMIYAESRRMPAWKLQLKTAFLNFLFIIGEAEVQVREPVKAAVQSHFLDSLDYLEKNIRNKITLDKLAKLAGMSVSGYTAQFRNTVGISPMEYLISLRISQARQLLIHSDMKLAEIADACGFCDTNYMIKLFRLREKITPGKLRRGQKA